MTKVGFEGSLQSIGVYYSDITDHNNASLTFVHDGDVTKAQSKKIVSFCKKHGVTIVVYDKGASFQMI